MEWTIIIIIIIITITSIIIIIIIIIIISISTIIIIITIIITITITITNTITITINNINNTNALSPSSYNISPYNSNLCVFTYKHGNDNISEMALRLQKHCNYSLESGWYSDHVPCWFLLPCCPAKMPQYGDQILSSATTGLWFMANSSIPLLVGSDVKEREGPLCVGGMADAAVLHIAPTYSALLCWAVLCSAELYPILLCFTLLSWLLLCCSVLCFVVLHIAPT